MLQREGFALDANTWCELNRPDITDDEADVVIFGIPFDGGVSYRGGAAEAPDTLRANTLESSACTERLDFFADLQVYDAGNFVGTRDEIFADVEAYVEHLVRKGRRFTMVGGDHSCTIPVQRGIDRAVDGQLGIIHVDAHMDLCDEMHGDVLSHGSTERRALELDHVSGPQNIYFVGIRSIEPDEFAYMRENPLQVKTAFDCFHEGMGKVTEDVITAMSAFEQVYLTLDIDSLDPAYAGGTGTPQMGGLTARMLLDFVNALFGHLNIIGFDVVEIAPRLDDSLASMYAGRKLITEGWGNWARELGKLESAR